MLATSTLKYKIELPSVPFHLILFCWLLCLLSHFFASSPSFFPMCSLHHLYCYKLLSHYNLSFVPQTLLWTPNVPQSTFYYLTNPSSFILPSFNMNVLFPSQYFLSLCLSVPLSVSPLPTQKCLWKYWLPFLFSNTHFDRNNDSLLFTATEMEFSEWRRSLKNQLEEQCTSVN